MLNENRTILLEKLLRKCELLVELNMKNNGAPGNDKINAFYIKELSSTHPHLISQFNDIFENNKSLPQWLVRGKTILLPKNIDTKLTKNQLPLTTKLTKNQHA